MIGRLLLFDALGMTFREMKLKKDPACPVCGERATIRQLIDYEAFCGTAAPEPAGKESMTITAKELKAELDRKMPVVLLDVREPHEVDICTIPGSTLIPLGELEGRIGELDRSSNIVAYCHAGGRSARAVAFLRGAGFTKVRNLTGGILAWADDVDPSMSKY